ncbi:MAG: hypothetical protein AAB217_16335, partial [Chloroflexota bacterium]
GASTQVRMVSAPLQSHCRVSTVSLARCGIAVASDVSAPAAAVRWEMFGEGRFDEGGLVIASNGGAVTPVEAADFTFEAAGGQSAGVIGAAYGIVFGYQNEQNYVAVLINGNGYVEVTGVDGTEWIAWQQWPNILLGDEANRLRVDVSGGEGLIRINDEVLMRLPVGEGKVGVVGRGLEPGQEVRFGWAKLWEK